MAAIWTQYNPVKVISGAGARFRLADLLPAGQALLLTSAGMIRRGMTEWLDRCPQTGWTVRTIGDNPDVDSLDALLAELRGTNFAAVVALGGGSVLDAGKALAALLPGQPQVTLNKLMRSARPPALPAAALPLYCLPTTAGTGAEVTPFATIWDLRLQKKHSLTGEQLYARYALLDAELTCSLPWEVTLYGAMDTISHALETLWNRNATPVSGALAMEALHMAVEALPVVQRCAEASEGRERMQQASLLAGLAISQSRTALAHALSYGISLRFGIPHGFACSFSLPAIMRWVQRERAWKIEPDAALIRAVQACFDTYAVERLVLDKCPPHELAQCVRSAFSTDRLGNFMLDVTPAAVERALVRVWTGEESA